MATPVITRHKMNITRHVGITHASRLRQYAGLRLVSRLRNAAKVRLRAMGLVTLVIGHNAMLVRHKTR